MRGSECDILLLHLQLILTNMDGDAPVLPSLAAEKLHSYLVSPKPMISNKDILKTDASYPLCICS